MTGLRRAALAGATALFCLAPAAARAGDAAHGQVLYESCSDCHSLDKNGVGPAHRGVFGRKAGSVAGYDYSPALKKSGIVWTEATLDRWLAGPDDFVPGAKMYFSVSDPKDRADLIAYLKEKAK